MKEDIKHISDLFASFSQEELKRLYIDEEEIHPGAGRVVNYLFKRFAGFISAFKYSADSTDSFDLIRREWAFAIRRSKIKTLEELNCGLNNLKSKGAIFLPPVAEFIAMCKPSLESFGLPPIMDAYKEACRNSHPCADKKWSHAAVFNAAYQTGYHELKTLPMKESYPIFVRNYEIMMHRIMNGESLEKSINKAIPEDINLPSTKEVAKSALEALKKSLI